MCYILLIALMLGSAQAQKSLYDDGHCSAHPDPHFSTWNSAYYDYHGGCDVVLIKSAMLDLHIRTQPMGSYAKISNVAFSFGQDVVEFTDNSTVLINGVSPATLPSTVSGFPFTITVTTYQTSYEVSMDGGQYIRVNMWYGSLSVQVFANGVDFNDATGMCGTWSTAGLIGRDGVTDFTGNGHDFGEEWQVDSSDPVLMSTPGEATCLPAGGCIKEGCNPDDPRGDGHDNTNGQDHADGQLVDLIDPVEACQGIVDDNLRANCEFDVRITGDLAFTKQPIYVDPFVMPAPRCDASNMCSKHGGKCVWRCDCSQYKCVRGLCGGRGCSCAIPKKKRHAGFRSSATHLSPTCIFAFVITFVLSFI